ncbi:MAG: FAD-binding oxidoreductase [Gemmatimonadaceae bacterium]
MRPDGFRGVFRDDLLARAAYAEGAGIARRIPAAVAVPADEDDAATLVRWAALTATSLIPRGSGSGMAGGAVGGGVVVDVSRFDWMDDVVGQSIWVGAGALRGAVNARARRAGLRFPVDPSSGAFCTIGGMTATNAAGAHTLLFGAMRSWVKSIGCVFDDGSHAIVERGSPAPAGIPAVRRFVSDALPAIRGQPVALLSHAAVKKDSSGYALSELARTGEGDLVDVLVGSEGTLALILGVELALAPIAPATSSLLVAFPSLEAAVDGALLARAGLASACELLDRTFLEVVASAADGQSLVPGGAEAVLLIEVEGENAGEAAARAGALAREMRRVGATEVRTALEPDAEVALWSLRHAASPILSRLDPSLKSMQFIEDGALPPDLLATYVRGVRQALASRDIRGVIFGHAGDAHVHVNPLVDVRRSGWRRTVIDLLDEVSDLTGRLGGTLAGEHGDGRVRTPLLDRTWSREARELFALVKRCFDPKGIFNPGVKVPVEGQLPIEDIKYDPALPPLPAAARSALDLVERERRYDRFRLSLVDGPT